MKSFTGKALRWEWREGVIELTLDHEPANEIGTAMLAELEQFVAAFPALIHGDRRLHYLQQPPARFFGGRRPSRALSWSRTTLRKRAALRRAHVS